MSVRRTDPYPDLADLTSLGPGAVDVGMQTHSYAVGSVGDGGCVVIDASAPALVGLLLGLRDEGRPPTALVYSHRHVIPQSADFLVAVRDVFPDVPVLLAPVDAVHPQAARVAQAIGLDLGDPHRHPALAAVGLAAEPMPGHTEGSTVFRWSRHGGVLFAGDAAMGATDSQHAQGLARLVRPPVAFNVDDDGLRRRWASRLRSLDLSGIAPYHGRAYYDRADLGAIAAPTARPEPTGGLGGEPAGQPRRSPGLA